ncbi:unnamed protein product [Mytilus coruscus]|uniref:Integrase catalytic domain-containing protein n=1 Tax=Mytilus coruscus TaxID=42192 RepID=A0A6J8CIL0_MYTCO|nr:unnamed protein product [Mytilus coruscus]
MKQNNVGAPMERVALDIIGPLPISYKMNKYALIVTDYFTKRVEGYTMPDMETTAIVDNLDNHFFYRFGIHSQMHSDQGRHLMLDETCILPDSTVYKLTATCIRDPPFCTLKQNETQTEMMKTDDAEIQTEMRQQISTQTEEDKRVMQVTSATHTRRIILMEEEVQLEIEDNRIVVEKETETEEDYMDLDFYH